MKNKKVEMRNGSALVDFYENKITEFKILILEISVNFMPQTTKRIFSKKFNNLRNRSSWKKKFK
jgi:hypothetical protein